MPFHALIPSLLGPILLASDETSLLGLYFTDQRDLPQVPGVERATTAVSDPTAGIQDGRAIRTFKVMRMQTAVESGDLFAAERVPAPVSVPGRGRADVSVPSSNDTRAGPASLHLLQADTPAGALAVLEQTRRELDEYWRGARTVFEMPLAPRGRRSSTRSGRPCWKSPAARRCPMANWPSTPAWARATAAQSARPWAATPSASSFPATASWPATAP